MVVDDRYYDNEVTLKILGHLSQTYCKMSESQSNYYLQTVIWSFLKSTFSEPFFLFSWCQGVL